ncbi:PREDICTED: uncharacterized protein LOC109590199 [Amphimedon queenslandica]|uniref:Peptidase S8/S53 domain-containing protein n=1 Tax=Amphimedon queenslandica TaxID=400682 RepID=A0AAN0JXN3_AMPQE|nr:PREDICTED: uncharacterized protein LOC109590199 [Amphimedon queenslandica]|eukprot:XP_019861678.1 PREDICTED: uncharacterized protein LOC109590199 [Amphimedon queenslandica]
MSPSFSFAFFLFIAVTLAFANVESRRVIRAAPGEETTGNYIVVMKKETNHSTFEHIADEVRRESIDQKLSVKVGGPFAKIVTAKMTEDAAHRIMQHEGVFIEEETYASIDMSWAVDRVDQVSRILDNQPYTPCECGNGVDLYVLDTGIRYDHCEFGGGAKYPDYNYVFGGRAKYPGYDPIDNYNDTNLEGRDCHGHGTHIASLAVGNVSGLARCATVYSVRVLDCNGRGPYSVVIDGLNYAASKVRMTRRPSVILMSLGGSFSSSLNQVVTNVVNQGIPVVTSAGNGRGNACTKSPASNPGAITVGSTLIGDYINFNTNAGPCVDILAPGAFVTAASHTCSTCSCTKVVSGTSVAAALVSGAVALLLEKDPLLSPANISDELKENCLKNAINYILLDSHYKSNTNNCLLNIKHCNVCEITPTSVFIVSHTINLTHVISSEVTTVSSETITLMKNTTIFKNATLTINTTVLNITTPIYNTTLTQHSNITHHITTTSSTTLTCKASTTVHITSIHHTTYTCCSTKMDPTTLVHTTTSTHVIPVTYSCPVTICTTPPSVVYHSETTTATFYCTVTVDRHNNICSYNNNLRCQRPL